MGRPDPRRFDAGRSEPVWWRDAACVGERSRNARDRCPLTCSKPSRSCLDRAACPPIGQRTGNPSVTAKVSGRSVSGLFVREQRAGRASRCKRRQLPVSAEQSHETRRCAGKPDKLGAGVGQAVATCFDTARKVRAPQGKVPGNAWAA